MPMTNEKCLNGAGHRPRGEEMDLVSSHQRLLVGAALRTKGVMLEFGVGWYSTPILHEIAETQKRQLFTYDNNEHWLAQFKPLESEYHKLQLVGWWAECPAFSSKLWGIKDPNSTIGLVFIDQGQPCEREYAIRKLIDWADVFVLHDTEELAAYGYSRTLPMFTYQYTEKCHKVWTTVASNTVDVSNWFTDLPPVEPTEEVT